MSKKLNLTKEDLELNFPVAEAPLLEGSGAPVSWEQFMAETAWTTRRYFEKFGSHEPPKPPMEPFVL